MKTIAKPLFWTRNIGKPKQNHSFTAKCKENPYKTIVFSRKAKKLTKNPKNQKNQSFKLNLQMQQVQRFS